MVHLVDASSVDGQGGSPLGPKVTLLATLTTLMDLSPALVSTCFDTLIDCPVVDGDNAAVTWELEELTAVSAQCCLRTLSHIAATDYHFTRAQTVYQVISVEDRLRKPPPHHSLRAIHNIFYSSQPKIQWDAY